MKNKIDLRVLKTEESIKSAFKTILLEMPYEKITIKDGKKIPVQEVIDMASTFIKTGLEKYMK